MAVLRASGGVFRIIRHGRYSRHGDLRPVLGEMTKLTGEVMGSLGAGCMPPISLDPPSRQSAVLHPRAHHSQQFLTFHRALTA